MVVDSLQPRSGNVEGAEVLQAVALLLAAGIPRPDAATPSRSLMLAALMAEYEDTIVAIVLPALIGALCSTCAVTQEASAWACFSWTSGIAWYCFYLLFLEGKVDYFVKAEYVPRMMEDPP